MRERYYTIARELKSKLSHDMVVIDMRIFGSCARGDEAEDSDIDIFIEVEELNKQAKDKIREISWMVGLDNFAVLSPLIFSRNELENTPMRSSPIVENILREGVAV